jgi:uncharacterized membrane protein YdjX (TVP38/TMEM64 family)
MAAMNANLKRFLPIIVLVVASVAVFASGLHRQISLTALAENEGRLRDFIASNGLLAIGLFMAAYTAVVALSLPAGAVLTIGGGFLFGLAIGGPAVVFSATIGAAIVFLVARTAFGESLAKKAGPALSKLADGFKQDAASYMLFLRLAPVFPFALVNIAPALLGVPFRTYLWTTLVGIMPGTLAFSSIGAGLGSVIATQRTALEACKASGKTDCALSISPGDLITREVLIAFFLLAVAALLPVIIKRVMARRNISA